MTEESSNNKEQMSYGFVCILDALGTKGIWKNRNATDHVEKILSLRNLANNAISQLEYESESNKIKLIFFSDTVLILQLVNDIQDYNKNCKLFINFTTFVSVFFSYAIPILQVLYRGAISHGYFYEKENIIIGPAVDDAASYYEATDWGGIVLTPSASYQMSALLKQFASTSICDLEYLIDNSEFKIPIKNNSSIDATNMISLNWPIWFDQSLNTIAKIFFENKQTVNAKPYLLDFFSKNYIPPEATKKFSNTLAFYDYCINKYPIKK